MITAAGNPLRERGTLLRRYALYGFVFCIVSAMGVHLIVFGTDWGRMGTFADVFGIVMSLAPDLSFMPKIVGPLLQTLLMAFWGTLLAVLLSIPVSYLAASNITPHVMLTYPLGRGVIVLSRSTHEIIFALVYVAALGLGPLPGILALASRSVGFMSKTTAEAIENIERGPIEAIEATGAAPIKRFLFGVVPQVLPIFIGNAIFQLDINIRRAAILGMVGAGGIGLYFAEQMKIYEYGNASACVLGVVLLVVVGEVVSNRVRTKLISG